MGRKQKEKGDAKEYNTSLLALFRSKRRRGRPPKYQQNVAEVRAAYAELEKLPDDAYISPNEAGLSLGVTGEAVKQWIYHRQLPATKLPNGYWKIRVGDFKAYIRSRVDASCRRILLADTSENSVAEIQNIIEDLGHKCVIASNTTDALLKASDVYPAIVIINMSCSDIDGWKIAQKLREKEGVRRVPILLISSKAETDAETERALELNIQGFMRRPLDKEKFKKEITRILGGALA
ncbi:MAG: response regulator [Planctomycetota bacterium]|nr:response regulator [Planctomycetota bacterium]